MIEETYPVKNIYGKFRKPELVKVEVPGSKSITNRALLLATLANGSSTLSGALFSDDSRYFLKCMEDLGFETGVDETACRIIVKGMGGRIPRKKAEIHVGNAGTAARFLTALLGLSRGEYYLDASAQMKKRPMAPLLHSLEALGTKVRYGEKEGFFPFTLTCEEITRNFVSVDIEKSSQFLSAFLISACCTGEEMDIRVEGRHGMAYIEMTIRMMEEFGVAVRRPAENLFRIERGQKYVALEYQIEPDVSAACYFYAMAAVLGMDVVVAGVHFSSMQGDLRFVRILERMGCGLSETSDGIRVSGPEDGILSGVHADMHACSDQAITLAAIAPFADSPTVITGIGHMRFQESDRIAAIVQNLNRMGIRCEEADDRLTIYPGKVQPAFVETHDDHRLAMGFSLTGLRAGGIVIRDPGCCRKTFENYFDVLDQVIGSLSQDTDR